MRPRNRKSRANLAHRYIAFHTIVCQKLRQTGRCRRGPLSFFRAYVTEYSKKTTCDTFRPHNALTYKEKLITIRQRDDDDNDTEHWDDVLRERATIFSSLKSRPRKGTGAHAPSFT